MSFQFLSGFFVANTLLFVASVLSPFGMATNLSMLALGALGLAIFGAQPESDPDDVNASLPSLLCILISGLAAGTLAYAVHRWRKADRKSVV